MNDKDEIRQYLNFQLSASGDDTVQVVQRILNHATPCTLVTIEGTMSSLTK